MIDAARRASAYKIVAVLPYYGYARQDRKDKPRVAIGSKLVANMLTAAGADRVVTMDLHAPQIQGYFDIPVDHLDSSAIFIPYIESLTLENLTFAAPDVGSANRIREIAFASPIPFTDCKSFNDNFPSSFRLLLPNLRISLASSSADLSLCPLIIKIARSSESLKPAAPFDISFSLGRSSMAQFLIEVEVLLKCSIL